jgi:hypothetical protein
MVRRLEQAVVQRRLGARKGVEAALYQLRLLAEPTTALASPEKR